MNSTSLQAISQTLSAYINIKLPQYTHWRTDSVSILVFDMYKKLMQDMPELEAMMLVRHFVEEPLDGDEGPSVILSLERMNQRSEFALSCEGDLITSWYEYDKKEMN